MREYQSRVWKPICNTCITPKSPNGSQYVLQTCPWINTDVRFHNPAWLQLSHWKGSLIKGSWILINIDQYWSSKMTDDGADGKFAPWWTSVVIQYNDDVIFILLMHYDSGTKVRLFRQAADRNSTIPIFWCQNVQYVLRQEKASKSYLKSTTRGQSGSTASVHSQLSLVLGMGAKLCGD